MIARGGVVDHGMEARVLASLAAMGADHEIVRIPPEQADTAVFCETHGFSLDVAANAIVVATRKEPRRHACCVVLGTRRLDVNRRVRELLGGGKVSFARAEDMRSLTGMEVGGVTPFCLPESVPLYLCGELMRRERVIVGTGGRSSKVLVAPAVLARLPGATVVEDLSLPR